MPGRTFDLIKRGSLATSMIKYFIIDEADKMHNMGFIEQVIIKMLPKKRVTLLFSATILEDIETLCEKYMENPKKIEISVENVNSDKISQIVYDIEENKKLEFLRDVLYIENSNSCIVFCGTKEKVDLLCRKMKDMGLSCEALHGGMFQADRLKIMKILLKI